MHPGKTLPGWYRRWPSLQRRGERCGNIKGKVLADENGPATLCGCPNMAAMVVADGPTIEESVGFIGLCSECFRRVQYNVTTKGQWLAATGRAKPAAKKG